ncbi:hypothetical protein LEP1GSC052_1898 [Leptospira kmetyi serovar Malaysia str. Bejo-Iso9]|nr:hypothetical protein LEP1GSC052_1898 [Leptospira kmetyi serovar Malaysia str. Bejo-Iso9]
MTDCHWIVLKILNFLGNSDRLQFSAFGEDLSREVPGFPSCFQGSILLTAHFKTEFISSKKSNR